MLERLESGHVLRVDGQVAAAPDITTRSPNTMFDDVDELFRQLRELPVLDEPHVNVGIVLDQAGDFIRKATTAIDQSNERDLRDLEGRLQHAKLVGEFAKLGRWLDRVKQDERVAHEDAYERFVARHRLRVEFDETMAAATRALDELKFDQERRESFRQTKAQLADLDQKLAEKRRRLAWDAYVAGRGPMPAR